MGNTISYYIKKLFHKQEARLLMIGLDGAGKTTILYHLYHGKCIQTIPTVGFNVETYRCGNIFTTIWDIGGQQKIRPLWKHYYLNLNGLIFVIDCNDISRLHSKFGSTDDNVFDEIQRILYEPELKQIPILIFANKKDYPNSVNVQKLINILQIYKVKDRTWKIQSTNGITGEGIYEGFEWLSKHLHNI